VLNTLIIVGGSVVIGVVVNGAAGYAFAYCKAKWLRVAFWCLMAPIFVTRMTLIVAQFVVVAKLRMQGWPAVVLMNALWSTGIFLFRNYFREVPISILESARLDGANEWTVLTRIVLPLARPIVGCAIVFLGMGAMGDYVWQMLNLQVAEQQTYLVGLIAAATYQYQVRNVGFELAIGTALFIPYLVLFSVSSRYFIGGLTGGALKE